MRAELVTLIRRQPTLVTSLISSLRSTFVDNDQHLALPRPFKAIARRLPIEELSESDQSAILWFMSWTEDYDTVSVRLFLQHMNRHTEACKALDIKRHERTDLSCKRDLYPMFKMAVDLSTADMTSIMTDHRSLLAQSGTESTNFRVALNRAPPHRFIDVVNDHWFDQQAATALERIDFMLDYVDSPPLRQLREIIAAYYAAQLLTELGRHDLTTTYTPQSGLEAVMPLQNFDDSVESNTQQAKSSRAVSNDPSGSTMRISDNTSAASVDNATNFLAINKALKPNASEAKFFSCKPSLR